MESKQTALTAIPLYSGQWNLATAAHLLRRTTMGPTYAELINFSHLDLATAVSQVLTLDPIPPPPLVFRDESVDEPTVPQGETWVNTARPQGGGNYRGVSTRSWFSRWLSTSGANIQAQITLFWINHFAISRTPDFRMDYHRVAYYQEHGIGSMREMLKMITIEPGMLEFLDGDGNSKVHPNENYARELLELYTIGKGEEISPGDYTTYTEQDVQAISRVLTGWQIGDFLRNPEVDEMESVFYDDRHDTDAKELSYRFNNIVIYNAGQDEYKTLIDIIFDRIETAREMTRAVYRWFVYSEIDDNVEHNVIVPLADLLYQMDYNLSVMLECLFSSQHFYDQMTTNAIIKHPIDYVESAFRPFGGLEHVDYPSVHELYSAYNKKATDPGLLQMDWINPPSVAGWQAFYQRPGYYRNWISSSSLQLRKKLMLSFTDVRYSVSLNGEVTSLRFNFRDFMAGLSDPYDVDQLVDDCIIVFFCRPLSNAQRSHLRNMLIAPTSPTDFWRTLYTAYADNPEDTNVRRSFEDRFRKFIREIFSMVEFQLK